MELFAFFDLGRGILGLDISVESRNEVAVDVVCLETDKGAGI
jgi:hypothetical protein